MDVRCILTLECNVETRVLTKLENRSSQEKIMTDCTIDYTARSAKHLQRTASRTEDTGTVKVSSRPCLSSQIQSRGSTISIRIRTRGVEQSCSYKNIRLIQDLLYFHKNNTKLYNYILYVWKKKIELKYQKKKFFLIVGNFQYWKRKTSNFKESITNQKYFNTLFLAPDLTRRKPLVI